MCLSTVYMRSGHDEEVIMKEVVHIRAEGPGYWLSGLFGEKEFVEGRIQLLDFRDGRLVLQRTAG